MGYGYLECETLTEGLWNADESIVTVFKAGEEYKRPFEIKKLAESLQKILPAHRDNLQNPEAVTAYFRQTYWQKDKEGLDTEKIVECLVAGAGEGRTKMPWKVIYKVTWPNSKIYVGSDLTDTISYLGSPMRGLIEKDYSTRQSRRKLSLLKEIIWESCNAGDAEVRAKERELIVSLKANDPQYGYNRSPKFK